jgi:hypothetical protein
MEQLRTRKVCNICGAEEPEPWWEAPMNETIRELALSYVSPVKIHYLTLWDAIDVWGNTEGLEHG